jgi:hypothetical protein
LVGIRIQKHYTTTNHYNGEIIMNNLFKGGIFRSLLTLALLVFAAVVVLAAAWILLLLIIRAWAYIGLPLALITGFLLYRVRDFQVLVSRRIPFLRGTPITYPTGVAISTAALMAVTSFASIRYVNIADREKQAALITPTPTSQSSVALVFPTDTPEYVPPTRSPTLTPIVLIAPTELPPTAILTATPEPSDPVEIYRTLGELGEQLAGIGINLSTESEPFGDGEIWRSIDRDDGSDGGTISVVVFTLRGQVFIVNTNFYNGWESDKDDVEGIRNFRVEYLAKVLNITFPDWIESHDWLTQAISESTQEVLQSKKNEDAAVRNFSKNAIDFDLKHYVSKKDKLSYWSLNIRDNDVLAQVVLPTDTPVARKPKPKATAKPVTTPLGLVAPVAPQPTLEPTPQPLPPTAEPPTALPPAAPAPGQPSFNGNRVDPAWYPCQQGQIKGNRNSGIYHPPSGRDYSKTYKNVQCFNSEAEAQSGGFRAAKQ